MKVGGHSMLVFLSRPRLRHSNDCRAAYLRGKLIRSLMPSDWILEIKIIGLTLATLKNIRWMHRNLEVPFLSHEPCLSDQRFRKWEAGCGNNADSSLIRASLASEQRSR
jgi:hypothetical protein